RHRARHRQRSDDHHGRRADGRPRSEVGGRHPQPAREAQRRVQEDHPDGHPRSARRRARGHHAQARQGTAPVKLVLIALRNLMRNKLRTVLTVAGAAVAILAFVMLRTVLSAWSAAADYSAKDRVATRHKVSFVIPMPKRYIDTIRD